MLFAAYKSQYNYSEVAFYRVPLQNRNDGEENAADYVLKMPPRGGTASRQRGAGIKARRGTGREPAAVLARAFQEIACRCPKGAPAPIRRT